MTLPMAVLVAVLYTFSHLAADSEITAMRASGVSVVQLLRPMSWRASAHGAQFLVHRPGSAPEQRPAPEPADQHSAQEADPRAARAGHQRNPAERPVPASQPDRRATRAAPQRDHLRHGGRPTAGGSSTPTAAQMALRRQGTDLSSGSSTAPSTPSSRATQPAPGHRLPHQHHPGQGRLQPARPGDQRRRAGRPGDEHLRDDGSRSGRRARRRWRRRRRRLALERDLHAPAGPPPRRRPARSRRRSSRPTAMSWRGLQRRWGRPSRLDRTATFEEETYRDQHVEPPPRKPAPPSP